MKRTIRLLVMPVAAMLILASCGSGDDQAAGEIGTGDETTAAEEAPVEEIDESDSWPVVDDGTPPGPFAPEGAVGGTLTGSVYTLGALEPLPDDIAAMILDAGYPEKDMEDLRLLPVDIDNSQGSETEGMYSATAVTEDGQQYYFETLGGYLYTISEGYADAEGGGLGDPVYDALWDRYEEESVEVAPTAQDVGYIVVEGIEDPDSVKFTYFAIDPPMHGEPIPMMPID